MAAVAMSRGINANLLRRWVRDSEMKSAGDVSVEKAAMPAAPRPAFVPVTIPGPSAALGIRIEVRRGAISITVTWPVDAAAECATWMRELLR